MFVIMMFVITCSTDTTLLPQALHAHLIPAVTTSIPSRTKFHSCRLSSSHGQAFSDMMSVSVFCMLLFETQVLRPVPVVCVLPREAELLAARTGAKKTLFHEVGWQYQTNRCSNGRLLALSSFEMPGEDPVHQRSGTASDLTFKFDEDDTPHNSDMSGLAERLPHRPLLNSQPPMPLTHS